MFFIEVEGIEFVDGKFKVKIFGRRVVVRVVVIKLVL